jgi:HSP20 family protein
MVARIYLERLELGDDGRRLMALLDGGDVPSPGAAIEFTPPLDIIETDKALEIVVDLPGVAPDSVHVIFSRDTLVVGGQKVPRACQHRAAAFHLAERRFGRFARAVQLTGAYDGGAARATLKAGELRIVLPRIDDRRGAEIRIPVQAD